MNCDTARIYCGAVADDELALVPPGVLEHVRACHDCSTEVRWQRQAQDTLAGVLTAQPAPAVLPIPAARQRLARPRAAGLVAVAAAAALAAVMLLPAQLAQRHGAPAPRPAAEVALVDAARAYGQPATYASTDPAAVSGWSAAHGAQPVMAMPGAVLTGARVSTIRGREMVTIIYAGAVGTTEVTMVPARMAAGWPAMEAMMVDHTPVGLVHHANDLVIVATPDDGALHAAMTALQST